MNVRDDMRSWLRSQTTIEVNERLEWVWWWARWFLVVAGLVGGATVFSGTSQLGVVYVNSAAFLVANMGVLWLLRRGRLRSAFTSGFAIDTWVVVVNWWTVLQIPDKGEKPSDLYLILFPFFIAVIVRVGPVLGSAYAAVLTTLMALGDLQYQGVGSYAVTQLPTRVLFLVVTSGMTALLVARLRSGRESLRDAYLSLEEKEARFRSLFESAPVGIGLGGIDRRFIEANKALADLLGVGLDDFIGKRLMDFEVDPASRASSHLTQQLVSGEVDLVAGERHLHVRTGGTVWVDVVSAAVRDPAGAVLYTIRIFEDITERKQMEHAKDEFLAMTSHELKSPITSILATFKLLASGTMGDVSAEADELLAGAERNAERLSLLVSDILDLQRMNLGADPLRLSACDAAELARNVVDMMSPVATDAGLALTVSGEAPKLTCDVERVEEVIMNLLSNAIRFSPNGSKIDVQVSSTDSDVEFAVQDDGPGIAEDHLEQVFEKFWQADASDAREAGGSGLGLAIAKAIVENHGGRIWVESGLGRGATFRFVLPAR
jgi:PAS domain S-box-containing protein